MCKRLIIFLLLFFFLFLSWKCINLLSLRDTVNEIAHLRASRTEEVPFPGTNETLLLRRFSPFSSHVNHSRMMVELTDFCREASYFLLPTEYIEEPRWYGRAFQAHFGNTLGIFGTKRLVGLV